MAEPRKIFNNVEELFAHLHSIDYEPEPEKLPELGEGEYLHLEYVQLNSVEDGSHLSNMVDLAHSRDEAVAKLHELIANEDVYAIHVRRYPQPEQGVHVYDESQPLAKAQSEAYVQRRRADALEKAYDEALADKNSLETGYDQIVNGLEDNEQALRRVIEKLMDRMRRVDNQLRSDVKSCSYSEPGELRNLMFGVGIVPDESWERKMLADARTTVRENRKHREAVDLAKRTGIWPIAPFDHGGATELRRCACGRVWHMDEVPVWHNGLECQKPTYAQEVAHAKKMGVWPMAKLQEGSKPPVRVCACGQEWLANTVPARHNGLECQPERCETSFNGGPCAGEKGHEDDCSPYPHDFVSCAVEGCGHRKERHTRMLPEEGGHAFCTECGTSGYQHDFAPARR